MKYLSAGLESQERIDLLLQLTSITSEGVIEALCWHLVKGMSEPNAAELAGVSISNFNRALVAINAKAAIVEKIKDHDWQHLKQRGNKP